MKQLILASLVFTTSICSLHAQQDGPTPTDNTVITDMEFVIRAYEAGLSISMFSNLAKTQGSSVMVQDLGKMTETHYNDSNSELQILADKNNISLPAQLPIEIQTEFETMKTKSETEFDTAFLEKMIMDYKNLVSLFENEVKNGQNDEIRLWAQRNLSKLKQILNNAVQLTAELK